MNKEKYVVAQILLDETGWCYLRWHGSHPDQGGLTERVGEVGFHDMEDLAKHGISMMMAHDTLASWIDKIRKIREIDEKKQKEEVKDESAVRSGNESHKVESAPDWDPQH